MQAEIFTLCDAATISDGGKMNLLGSFDTLCATGFPTRHPHCALACKIRFSEEEAGAHDLKIRIIDPDGKDVIPPMQVRTDIRVEEGRSSLYMNVWNFRNFLLSQPGEFYVDLVVDEVVICRQPLWVSFAG